MSNPDRINLNVLTEITSLNSPERTGVYYVTGNNIGALPPGLSNYGILLCMRSPYSLHPTNSNCVYVQEYTDVYGKHASRSFNNGAWTNWVTTATKDDLTAINSGSVTKSSYVTDGAITLHKNGRTAVLSSEIGITLSGTQGTGTTIFTLPTGFRPVTRLRIPCTTVISSEYVSRELQIETNGTCSLQGPNAGTAVRATFSASFYTT